MLLSCEVQPSFRTLDSCIPHKRQKAIHWLVPERLTVQSTARVQRMCRLPVGGRLLCRMLSGSYPHSFQPVQAREAVWPVL